MSARTPRLATATRVGDRVEILADGETVLVLNPSSALWLVARLAHVLARRA